MEVILKRQKQMNSLIKGVVVARNSHDTSAALLSCIDKLLKVLKVPTNMPLHAHRVRVGSQRGSWTQQQCESAFARRCELVTGVCCCVRAPGDGTVDVRTAAAKVRERYI